MKLQVNIDLNENQEGVLISSHFDLIRNKFSWANEKRKYASPQAKKFLPKREFVISVDGVFPIGILNEIFSFCKEIDPNLKGSQFQVSNKARYYYEPSFVLPKTYELHKFKGFPYRSIQTKGLERIFKRGRGTIRVGTGGGKGLIIASVCKTLLNYNPTQTFSILVPTNLVKKTYKEFRDEYGFSEDEVGIWHSDNKVEDFKPSIIIFGPNLAIARKETFLKEIANRNVFMTDEVHILKRESKITEMVKQVQTNNRIGFTGTLPDKEADRLSVVGNIGKVIYDVSSKDLKDEGLKAESKIYSILFKGSNFDPALVDITDELKPTTKTSPYDLEEEYLLTSPKRNEFIKKWILKVCKGVTLIPMDWNYHEDLLRELFKDCGRKTIFINGATPEEERLIIYNELENEKDTLVFVKTSIMTAGISIKNLSDIILIFGKKAYIRTLQLIGRIERIGGAKIPKVYDFHDETTYSSRHYKKRKEIYLKDEIPVSEQTINLDY